MPYLVPVELQNPAVWKIIGKFIKQDLSKVAMPCILNSPVNVLQKQCEMLAFVDLIYKARESNDAAYRVLCATLFFTLQYNLSQRQVKKPFNPLLGETYEMVEKEYRYLSEQVSHHPPITAFSMEGDGFEVLGHNHIT